MKRVDHFVYYGPTVGADIAAIHIRGGQEW